VILAVLLGVACGGDDGGGSPDAPPAAIDAPDAAPAVCNGDSLPTGAGCDPGRCALQFSTTAVTIGCCPDGTGVQGAACNPTAQQSLDHPGFVCDDCAIGFVCVDFVCHQVCDTRTNICAGGLTCTAIPGVPGAPNYGECE
jgi:hypothetical protein